MPILISNLYDFGEFRLDAQRRVLRRGAETVPLTPKAFEVLLLLIQHSGEIVTKDEIMRAVWPDSFVEESNLTQTVFMLRKALGETEEQRYILTAQGRGYQFIASVREIADSDRKQAPNGEATLASAADLQSESPDLASAQKKKVRIAAIIAAAAVAIAFVAYFAWPGPKRATDTGGNRVMLAVLPFQNLTGDTSQEYFSDGLTEEMITQLGNLDPEHLGVIARTSVMHYKNSQTGLDQIGRELGVQYVIEGSVRRDRNNIRVTAQLIQTKDQTHVWARQYDREIVGLLSLQTEIAQEVADEIHLTLDHKPLSVQASSTPESYQAYDLYLKGQYFLNKRTLGDLQQSVVYFEEATRQDPTNARAYAGIAAACALLPGYSGRSQVEFINKARASAMMALKLDDGLPEAHTALALIVQNYDWDWQTAEKEFRRAIELNPNYATAHHWYAEHLMWRGRFEDAMRESEHARELDPLSLIIAADNGAILFFSRQYDKAIEKWNSVLVMDPYFVRAALIKAAYIETGHLPIALESAEKQRSRDVASSYWAWRAYMYGRFGKMPEAHRALQELLRISRTQPTDPMLLTRAYIGTREWDLALVNLEKAYVQHSNELVALKVDPAYDPLRNDPRFKDVLRRVGLN